MGQSNSSLQNQEIKKYTSAEIEANLQRLFKNNINNIFSEASQTFGQVNFSEYDGPEMQLPEARPQLQRGNGIKFKSSKNRHLQHNIDQFLKQIQTGGNENLQQISEQSEFAKIKKFLLDEANRAQTGGVVEDGIDYESISSISGFNELKSTLSQDGGKRRKKHKALTLANVLQSGQLGGDRDSDSGYNLSDESEDQLSVTSDQRVDIETAKLSSTSYSDNHNEEIEEGYSPTSSQVSASSELNIVPFYSSESSHAHPYTRNRLNK